MGVMKVTLNNSEKLTGTGMSVFDKKGKALVDPLPAGWQVTYSVEPGKETIAQFVQDAPNSLGGTVTTEGDDVGVAVITGSVIDPNGAVLADADGAAPQLEVTVINSAPGTASFTPGTVEPE